MDTKLKSNDRPIALYYSLKENVTAINRVDSVTVSVSLAESWYEINTSIGSIELNEDSKDSAAGTIYETNLIAIIPGHESTSPEQEINGRRVLLRVDYRNGLKKVIGDMEYFPKIFIAKQSKTSTSRNLKIDFKSNSPNKWLIIAD